MTQPIRPVKTFILRLWHEPGDLETEAGWRGLIRPLDSTNNRSNEISCRGLEDLIIALRQLLVTEVQSVPTAPDQRAAPIASELGTLQPQQNEDSVTVGAQSLDKRFKPQQQNREAAGGRLD